MKAPNWFPDEQAHAGAEHLDPRYVATYEIKAGVDPDEELAVLRRLGLGKSSVLIDFGAGTGVLALEAAPLCRRVIAVDISSVMIDLLRQKAARLEHSNLEIVQSGFLTYEHWGERADFVYSRNALHHLPDFWKGIALQQVAATLKGGGVMFLRDLVFSFDPEDAERIIEAWLHGAPDRPEHGWTAAELATHVREEHSTYSWLLEPLIEHAGFEIREAEYSSSKIFVAYTCVKI